MIDEYRKRLLLLIRSFHQYSTRVNSLFQKKKIIIFYIYILSLSSEMYYLSVKIVSIKQIFV